MCGLQNMEDDSGQDHTDTGHGGHEGTIEHHAADHNVPQDPKRKRHPATVNMDCSIISKETSTKMHTSF